MRSISIIRNIFVAGVLVFGLAIKSVSQAPTPPAIVPPSPNAFAFSKYGNIPISPYNGVPNISIPIFDISYGDIKVPITISYHASGIKVAEESSRVGLGWVLNAGGIISRNVVNKDDLQFDSRFYLGSSGGAGGPVIPMGPFSPPYRAVQTDYLYKYMDPQNSGSTLQLDLFNNQDFDFEPDQFNYNFLNYSGSFVLNRAGDPVLEKQEKIRIKLSSTRDTWEVTTADGYIYKFLDSESFQDNGSTSGYFQKSAWYLSEILSPTGASVKFYYSTQPSAYLTPVGSVYERIGQLVFSCANFSCSPPQNSPPVQVPAKNYTNIMLDSIGWKTGRIVFNYLPRLDIDGDKKLSSVQIIKKNNTTPSEEVVFNQGYFTSVSAGPLSSIQYSTLDQEKANLRMKLTSITRRAVPVITGAQVEQHFFEYYEDVNKPYPPKNSFARDHWGYYNGNMSSTSLLPKYSWSASSAINIQQMGVMGTEKDPSADYMYLLSLKSITYPTAGKTNFYYEPNDFEYTTTSSTGDDGEPEAYSVTTPFLYNMSNKGVIQSKPFDLSAEFQDAQNNTVPVTFKGAFRTNLVTPCNLITGTMDVYFELYNAAGASYGTITPNGTRCSPPTEGGCVTCLAGSMVFEYSGTLILPPGLYTWRAYAGSSEAKIFDISAQYTWTADARKLAPGVNEPDGSIKKYKLAGGLRIKRIEDYDPESGQLVNVKRYDYHYQTDVDGDGIKESHSYGKRMVKPSYSYYDVGWEYKVTLPDPTYYECTSCLTVVRDSGHPQANYSGPSVGYDQVTEYQGVNGENGYTIYEYANFENQMLSFQNPYLPVVPLQPPLYNSTKNGDSGNLLRQTHYTANGTKLMMTQNFYTKTYNAIAYGVTMRWFKIDLNRWGGTTGAHLILTYPSMNSYFYYLTNTRTINYAPFNIPTNNTYKEFAYEVQDHLQLTTETVYESDQHKTITKYKYPMDYTVAQSSAAVTSMKDKFMHKLPIQVTVLDETAAGTQTIKHREFTVYENIGASFTLPTQKVLLQNSSPAVITTPEYIPSATTYDTTLYKVVFSLGYNTSGNINKIQNKLDAPTAYLWGHKESLPVAEIKNALTSQCFYTSFEEDGDLFPDALGNAAKTGLRVKTAASYTFPASYAPVVGNTVMSYWYYQSGQWNFSGIVPYQSTITTTGTKIDEVRAYPKWAQMTTFTHIPEVGMSSTTNANNFTTAYEYDEMGRLKIVRDNNKKILKAYSYILKK